MKASPRVTITSIAKEAGVSVGTVSRVLNGKNKDAWPSAAATSRKIRRIAERLNYRPSWAARSMVQNRSHTIGVLIRNTRERQFVFPQAMETILGINEHLTANDYMLSLVHLHEFEVEDTVPRVFREQVLDGIIVLGGNMPTKAEQAIDLIQRDIAPCVWVEGNRWHETGTLQRDELQVGELAAERVIAAGYRRVIMIGTSSSVHYSERDRLAGVQAATARHGIELLLRPVHCEPFHRELIAILQDIALTPEIAVIVSGTRHAASLAVVASELGLRIGVDFGLACCDDDHNTEQVFPTLSRVNFDRFDLGVQAATMMLGALDDDADAMRSKRISGQWLERSSAPGPGAPR